MKYSKIIWGIVLVLFGVLVLLRNLGLPGISASAVLRLWPLIFIFWGISLLPVKEIVKVILSLVFLFGGIAISISTDSKNDYHFFFDNNCTRDKSESDTYYNKILSEPFISDITEAHLDFDAAAGKFVLQGTTENIFTLDNSKNIGTYNIQSKIEKNEQFIDIDLKKILNYENNNKHSSHLKLNSTPVWTLNFDVGAADMELDLKPFKINQLEIDCGAASISITLGNEIKMTNVHIDAGAASVNINIPATSGCEIKSNSILSDTHFEGFTKIERGLHRTPGFEQASNKIIINANMAVSGFNVIKY